jgi:hypothetical protein
MTQPAEVARRSPQHGKGYLSRRLAPLRLAAGATAEDLRRALEGRELVSGPLVGTYQR